MKTRNFLSMLALIAAMFAGGNAIAQTESSVTAIDSEWSLLAEEDGIQFFAKKELCPTSSKQLASNYSFIKIVNTTSSEVMVEWQLGVQYDLECVACVPHNESIVGTKIPANSSVEGDCSFSENGELSKFINMVDNPHDSRVFQGVKLITFKKY